MVWKYAVTYENDNKNARQIKHKHRKINGRRLNIIQYLRMAVHLRKHLPDQRFRSGLNPLHGGGQKKRNKYIELSTLGCHF